MKMGQNAGDVSGNWPPFPWPWTLYSLVDDLDNDGYFLIQFSKNFARVKQVNYLQSNESQEHPRATG